MKLPTLFIELSIFSPAVLAVDCALSMVLLSARAEPLTRTLPRVTASRVLEILSLVIFIDVFLCFARHSSDKRPLLLVLYFANKHTGKMENLKSCIEQFIHPHPVLNTELNIDHSRSVAFRIG